MKNRSLLISLVVLLSLLISATVYASITNSLQFTGSVVFTPPLNLELTNPAIRSMRQDENIDLDLDKKTLSFFVILVQPGDERTVTFQIANTGNTPACLQNLLVQNPPATATGVTVTWPNLNNELLMPGVTSQEFTILVRWNPNVIGAPEGSVPLSASIQYTQEVDR
jgi:type 1 fimbria pilin